MLTIVVAAGETLPIGEVIARLDDGTGARRAGGRERRAAGAPQPPTAPAAPTRSPRPPTPPSRRGTRRRRRRRRRQPAAAAHAAPRRRRARETGRVKASPLARRMAREQGIDLHLIGAPAPAGGSSRPTSRTRRRPAPRRLADGPAASAPEAPVAAEPGAPKPATGRRRPPSRPRAPPKPAETGTAKGDITIVRAHAHPAGHRAPDGRVEGDRARVHAALGDRHGGLRRAARQLKALGGEVPSYNDMVVKACALALREFPRANGSYKDGKFELHSRVNVGVAVAADRRARRADDLRRRRASRCARSPARSRALAEKVRAGTVTPPELSGGTFTVSNLGMFGVTDFTAVINPPQAAILAVGALAPRAVVRDGELVARNTMGVTLACDHRILYGADAAQFLARIRELLEQPLALAF